MRKFILSALLVGMSAAVFAQNLDNVKGDISKGKYNEAKEGIEKMLTNSKNQKNPEVWYQKAIIYTNLSLDSTKAAAASENRAEAYKALKTYYELDPKNVIGTLEQNARLWQLYEGYYSSAVNAYNNNDFTGSFNNFRNALEIGEYINGKGFSYNGTTLPALDTNLILNVAATATKAQMEDSAMSYYKRLADARLNDEKFIEIYQMLTNYYKTKNDQENYSKYYALGKELFPGDYWHDVELSALKDDKPKLLDKYAQLVKENPESYYLNYNYAVELFNYIYANESKPADASKYQPLIQGAIENSIKADTSMNSNLLMVRYHISEINNLEDSLNKISGTKPADLQKKKNFTTSINAHYDKLFPYSEAIFNDFLSKDDLKGSDKGNLRFVGNTMIDYYDRKKQPEKANQIEAKMKAKS